MCETKRNKNWSRRSFVKTGGLSLFTTTLGGLPNFVAKAATSILEPPLFKRKKVLVCIFQRGAMDGISAVQPIDSAFLKKHRPNLIFSATGNGSQKLLDLDASFGLHPELAPLAPYYKNGTLAILHGVGSPVPNRSHFDAQDFMESGTPGIKGTQSGWLNRAVGAMGHDATPFKAVSFTPTSPRSFYGEHAHIVVQNLSDLNFSPAELEELQTLKAKYQNENMAVLANAGIQNIEAAEMMASLDVLNQPVNPDSQYPISPLGQGLKQTAKLIKANAGLEIAFVESNGWDTHSRQNVNYGGFTLRARDLAKSIAAFWEDLGVLQDDVVVMTMTEFGRTVLENGSFGTDHGRASCSFILGTQVNGGKIYGKVPELALENLEDRRDLPVTTDFRSYFATVASQHLNIADVSSLFPDWKGEMLDLFS
ncbi:MAG: DUF1501 domain-containing protein [Bacteroidota bacterium]